MVTASDRPTINPHLRASGPKEATMTNLRSLFGSLAVIALLGFGAPAFADEMKVPQTAADHEALAKTYESKAADYEKEAQFHRDMLADFKKTRPETNKTGKRGDVAKMEQHCTTLIKDAEKLATDTKKSAEYHHLRAKELEGK
jgi:hypothetical protein